MQYKTILTIGFSFILVAGASVSSKGQAFRKGSVEINLSEGWSAARYSTNDLTTNNLIGEKNITGDRDPFSIEYGISSRWGIGLSSGYDIFQVNPSSMYSFSTPLNQIKTASSECTIDCSYHFFVSDKTDLSCVLSFGGSSVTFKGNVSDYTYQYTANGGIIRLGVHARFFVWKHFGLLAMLSTYSLTDSPKGVSGNTVGNTYNTTISGTSLEFGFCFRFKK